MSNKQTFELPPAVFTNGRFHFLKSQIAHLQKTLVARAIGKPAPKYVEPDVDSFLSVSDVASIFNVSTRTVWRRIHAKDAERIKAEAPTRRLKNRAEQERAKQSA